MEMRETFKKSDLKTGMIVEFRNGNRYTVMLNTVNTADKAVDVLISAENSLSWMPLHDYNDDLRCHFEDDRGNIQEDDDYDIVKVYEPRHCYSFVASKKFNGYYCADDNMLIWKRKERRDFLDDKDAMIDFLALSKDAFLFSHYAYTEEMYDNTYALVEEKLGLR